MKTKYLLVGDVHLRHDNLDVAEQLFRLIRSMAKDYTGIIFMGDIFDVKGIIRVEVQNFLYHWLGELLCSKEVHILVGNHDMVGVTPQQHAFKFLDSLNVSQLWIHDRPQLIELVPGFKVIMSPYIHDSSIFVTEINKLAAQCRHCLVLCHQSFKGFVYSSVSKNHTIGDEGVVQDRIVDNVGGLLSGHVHIRACTDRVQYVSIPFTHNFGEVFTVPMLIELQIMDDGGWGTVEIPTVLPRHLQYDLSVNEEGLTMIGSFIHKESDHVRFVVSGPKEVALKYNKDALRTWIADRGYVLPASITLKYNFDIQNVLDTTVVKESDTHLSMLDKYIDCQYKGQNLSLVKTIGERIMHNASQTI